MRASSGTTWREIFARDKHEFNLEPRSMAQGHTLSLMDGASSSSSSSAKDASPSPVLDDEGNPVDIDSLLTQFTVRRSSCVSGELTDEITCPYFCVRHVDLYRHRRL